MASNAQLKFLLSTIQGLQLTHLEDCEMSIDTECSTSDFTVTVSNLCKCHDGEKKVFRFQSNEDGDALLDKLKEIKRMIEL